ncbi:MAG: glycogen synthase GlgA [Acidobacteria bacterium]|nr:glycogen synthase GlgA [Acidobacteriota bacterium]
MKIVFCASEGVPFSKTGGLADVVGALPQALAANGHEVQVILPRYKATKPAKVHPNGRSVTLALSGSFRYANVQDAGESGGVRTYLVDLPQYFDREGLYTVNGKDHPDNHLRFAAFSLACIEFLKRSGTAPDILHCHDWQSALLPVYLKSLYRGDDFYSKTGVVFTIHNIGYQGLFPPSILPEISVDSSLYTMEGLEFWGKVNLLKGGLVYSDYITTVSRKYAEEIQTAEFGYGLEGILAKRADRLQGILNGVDYDVWSPANDKHIAAKYGPQDLAGKQACKKALLQAMGAASPVLDRPVIGIVSRFAAQKGFDLIAGIAEQLMAMDLYIVALGTGEPQFEELFRTMAAKYPDKFLVRVGFDVALSHQIEAGSDMFLMPSRYEPCGLNQIYSLKYGTVPVVRATGGLDDTIEPFGGKTGTGFKFSDYTPEALLGAIEQAVACYRQPKAWRQVMINGMKKDFSWSNSAKQYIKVYQAARKTKSELKAASAASNA